MAAARMMNKQLRTNQHCSCTACHLSQGAAVPRHPPGSTWPSISRAARSCSSCLQRGALFQVQEEAAAAVTATAAMRPGAQAAQALASNARQQIRTQIERQDTRTQIFGTKQDQLHTDQLTHRAKRTKPKPLGSPVRSLRGRAAEVTEG